MLVSDLGERMKCLLCTRNFEDRYALKDHYSKTHKINPNNWFFKALFEQKNRGDFLVKKCYKCDEILVTQNQEDNHIFLVHYQKGGELHLEYKPIEIENISETIKNFR